MSGGFRERLAEANASALWLRPHRQALEEPPHLWPWAAIGPLLDRAVVETGMDDAERRVLVLENPAYRSTHRSGASLNLVVNLQILMPGETALPHRHRANALRFVLESDGGAATIVDGRSYPMLPGDLVLTPGWCWHAHRHDGEGRAVWLDALDLPLQTHLQTDAYEGGPASDMPPRAPQTAWESAGILPTTDGPGSPGPHIFRYPLATVRATLDAMAAAPDGSRRIRYTDPATGGAAMAGIDCYMLALARGRPSRACRSTANMVVLVVEGDGVSEVGGETLRWRRNDIAVLPRGRWISHRAESESVLLFQLTDREVLARLGYLREEFRG